MENINNFKFNLDINIMKKLVQKITNELKIPASFDTTQFLIDVVTSNYKINLKTYLKLTGYITLLVIPTEKLSSLVFGRLAFILDGVLLIFDELYFIQKIGEIIFGEMNSYNQFITTNKYKPGNLDGFKIDINKDEIILLIKEFISGVKTANKADMLPSMRINTSKTIVDFCKLTDEMYQQIIINYCLVNRDKYGFVTLRYPLIKSELLFPELFDERRCIEIVQTQMNDILLSSPTKLHTYRLTNIPTYEFNIQSPYNRRSKGFVSKQLKVSTSGGVRIINFEKSQLSTNNLSLLTNSLIWFLNRENAQKMIYVLDKFVIEISALDNFKVNVITNDVQMVGICQQLEKSLNNFLRPLRKLVKPKQYFGGDSQLDLNINHQLDHALYKYRAVNHLKEEVVIGQTKFLQQLPLGNTSGNNAYLIALQNKYQDVIVTKRDVVISVPKQEQSHQLLHSPGQVGFDCILFNLTNHGCLDSVHIYSILGQLFDIQYLNASNKVLDVLVNIDLGDGLILNVNLTSLNPTLIDGKIRLSSDKQNALNQLFIKELKANRLLLNS